MQHLTGLSGLIDAYDGYILDAWGTLHAGGAILPEALVAVQQLRARRKRVAVLSNTPQIGTVLARRLSDQGLPPALYDFPVTAGDIAHAALKAATDPWLAGIGRRALHLAPDRFPDLLPGTPFVAAEHVEEADLLVNGGPDRDDIPLSSFLTLLERAAGRDLPMICANPDRAIIDRGVRKMCAGELSAAYQELGGRVRYYGKPFPEVFEHTLARLGTAPGRTLVVGDGLATDIAGAAAAGLDSLLIADGLHADVLLAADGGLVPDPEAAVTAAVGACMAKFVMARLHW